MSDLDTTLGPEDKENASTEKPIPTPTEVPTPTPPAPIPSEITTPGTPVKAEKPKDITPGSTKPPSSSPTEPGDTDTPSTAGIDPLALEAASAFGRLDADGTVWVKEAAGERKVGQYPDELPEVPLELYVRRFLDLQAQVDLAETRLQNLNVKDIDATIDSLKKALEEPMAVGDLDALRTRFDALKEAGIQRKEELRKQREEDKKQALAQRTKIVAMAEKIASQDPARTQWKQSGQRLRDLLEEWKNAQRRGPRLERSTEDSLWKRFSSARTTFDRHRKQFFSQLDAQQASVKATKEDLIARAVALQSSTDWGATAGKYRDLMEEWKKAGRASRRDDDALWARFREAQQVFFDARSLASQRVDAEFADNLVAKEALLSKAEALLPITDLAKAKAALREIQEEWDASGKVPRADINRVEKRMRAVEQAVRDAEDSQWNRSNPETKARAEGLVGQLESIINELEVQIESAKKRGDAAKVKEYEENLAARRAWLNQAQQAADEES
ncbi:MAG: DUF349 domain-containing protein [Actinomycetaceae bacterium]|nr:DUF349 domain-containing protein [Actinomycetaceae bacterium]